jgi:hypothetical protein
MAHVPAREWVKRVPAFPPKTLATIGIVSIISIALASNGSISVMPPNQVSSTANQYRWEPSSADTGGWTMNWHDIGTTRGPIFLDATKAYTSVWNGGWAAGRFEHRANGNTMMDQYLYWDAVHARWSHVALDYGSQVGSWHSVYHSWSTNGSTWTGPTLCGTAATQNQRATGLAADLYVNISWDFPSVAVSSTGRIVAGASKIVGGNQGYWTAYSDDGGATWHGPNPVLSVRGGTSRLVWSQSGFHVFTVNTTGMPTYVLEHYQSSDGVTWVKQPNLSTYMMPWESATIPGLNPPGDLAFAAVPDAVASSGLGWVVAYPLNINGRNAINVVTELGGGTTVNYSTDLFSLGIATSSSGDWYLSYQTFQGGDRVLPVQEGVVYRVPGSNPVYLGATIEKGIQVGQWFYFTSDLHRCKNQPCYCSGDFFRPTMNKFTSASVPFILQSTYLNDATQMFIQDPATGNVPQFLPNIEPYVLGTDISWKGVVSSDLLERGPAGHVRLSPMIAEAYIQQFGALP